MPMLWAAKRRLVAPFMCVHYFVFSWNTSAVSPPARYWHSNTKCKDKKWGRFRFCPYSRLRGGRIFLHHPIHIHDGWQIANLPRPPTPLIVFSGLSGSWARRWSNDYLILIDFDLNITPFKDIKNTNENLIPLPSIASSKDGHAIPSSKVERTGFISRVFQKPVHSEQALKLLAFLLLLQ